MALLRITQPLGLKLKVATLNFGEVELEIIGDIFGGSAVQLTGSGLWVPPTGVTYVSGFMVSGGSGGGSGANTSGSRTGGAGAGSPQLTQFEASVSALGGSVSYSVGLGALGGAPQSTPLSNGNDGAKGGDTSFGPWLALAANAGQGGQPAGTATGGVGAAGQHEAQAGAGGTVNAGTAPSGVAELRGAGGSGGGISAGVASAGGNGSVSAWLNLIAALGGAIGNPGQNGPALLAAILGLGGGGGGGGSSVVAAASPGGNGGFPGGGGGGGGCGWQPFASGAGGNGADGTIILFLS